MRSPFRLLALGFVVLGLELSTQAVSLAVGRLGAGFTAVLNGTEMHVSSGRFLVGAGALLFGMVVLMVGVVLDRLERRLAKAGDRCPTCGSGTNRVKRKRAHRIVAMLMGHRVTRRQCEECNWVGLSFRY